MEPIQFDSLGTGSLSSTEGEKKSIDHNLTTRTLNSSELLFVGIEVVRYEVLSQLNTGGLHLGSVGVRRVRCRRCV